MNRDLVMKYLNSCGHKEANLKEILEQFTMKNRDFTVEGLLQLKSSNLDQLERILDNAYQLREMLTDVIQELNERDHFFYQICSYINTWNLFNKILEIEDEKEELNANIQMILENTPIAKELLRYLYANPRVEYPKINKKYKLYSDQESISNLLNLFCDKDIVYKVSIGDQTAYDLTENSRRWVEKDSKSRVHMAWSSGVLPVKKDSSNISVAIISPKFIFPKTAEKKYESIAERNNVYVAKKQPQDIVKSSLKSGKILNNSINKYNKANQILFVNSWGKDVKNGEFEMAGLFKGFK